MNKDDDAGAAANGSGGVGAVNQHKDGLLDAGSKNIVHWENTVIDNEAACQWREKSVAAREDALGGRENAANLREDAVDLREIFAQAREGDAHAREDAVSARERKMHAANAALSGGDDQLKLLQQANSNLVVAAIEARYLAEQIETAAAQLDHLAHHDVLTDLPNRMLLQDRIGQAIELAHRQGTQLAVMFMDLDRFKHINDSLGHAVGDQLLQSVAQRLVACVRHSDTVSRQGGDEFVLLLHSVEHAKDAANSAQKILAALALAHRIERHELYVSVSIGISIYPVDGLDAATLIKSADTAMYHAKAAGRNTYKFFEQVMNDQAVQRQSIETSLRGALERQEFVLHYQPKVQLSSGMIGSVEALIRWQHPVHGLLPPAQFVSIAEDCGLILPIGRWVLREACRQARAWQQAGLPPITVAVNTSALEFRDKDFLDNVRATLADTHLEPQFLELELTESVLIRDIASTNFMLHALAKLGIKLAIDDFGTGYSSLSYLRQFPIDTLKIDQSFVNQMTHNPDNATIVSAIISLGKSLQKRVIAEGVETAEQCAFLQAQLCDEAQGYYFSHPLPAEVLAALLLTGLPRRLFDR